MFSVGVTKVMPLSEVEGRFAEVVAEIGATGESVTVTRDGRPVAFLVAPGHLAESTLDVLSDPVVVRTIEVARTRRSADDYNADIHLEALLELLRAEKA